jgi:predicted ABC-type ATPase
VDLLRDLQAAGYFVVLIFVGLVSAELSIRRVETRVLEHGHGVPEPRLRERFPRTQKAIAAAIKVADASLLVDNSRDRTHAFTVCRVEVAGRETFDLRTGNAPVPPAVITRWLNIVSPREDRDALRR